MNQYRVKGSKSFLYWTVVTAESKEDAYDISQKDDIDWIGIETDDIIEPIEIDLVNDEEDTIINMSHGLIKDRME
jgi:hypothetical protein